MSNDFCFWDKETKAWWDQTKDCYYTSSCSHTYSERQKIKTSSYSNESNHSSDPSYTDDFLSEYCILGAHKTGRVGHFLSLLFAWFIWGTCEKEKEGKCVGFKSTFQIFLRQNLWLMLHAQPENKCTLRKKNPASKRSSVQGKKHLYIKPIKKQGYISKTVRPACLSLCLKVYTEN